MNVVIFLVLTPRTLAVWRGRDEDKAEYARSATKKLQGALRKRLKRRFQGGWSMSKSIGSIKEAESPVVDDYAHAAGMPLHSKLSIQTNDSFANGGVSMEDLTVK